ncbi:MAG: two-component regulator propeller domain-containing protein, partial [Verrucomicrobiota bacterium]
MEEDYEGSVWVGTDAGLFQLHRPSVRAFTSYDGLSSDHVFSVCEDSNGTIWAAVDNGVSTIRNGIVESLGALEPSLRIHSRCVWPKKDGGIWLSKVHGLLFHFSDGVFSEIETNSFLVSATADALYEDRSGRLWVGSRTGAVAFEGNRFDQPVISTVENGVKEVRAILEDRNGSIWFGTKKDGLACLRDGKYSRFTKLNGLSDDRVWSIYEDASGSLWLGTANGLTRYRNGKFFPFTLAHGLREKPINCVLEDDYGFFWLSGLQGVYRIKRDDLEAVADGRKSRLESITVGTVDGMESAETNGERQPSGWKARDGRLWFPTTRGLAVIDPKLVGQHDEHLRVVIEDVKANDNVVFNNTMILEDGEIVQNSSPAKIAAGNGHVIEFTYTANTFSKPEKTPFRYRLIGFDSKWHDETLERTVHYLNLPPGQYQFEVIAANRHGHWNEEPTIFPFSLEPQFWQTWLFYTACLAGLGGIVGSLHWYRLRWQRRLLKLDEQHALANERARIARDLHDDLGTALTGLALELDVVGAGENRVQPATDRVSAAAKHARGLAQRMREVVWAINPRCDTSASLSDFLEEQIAQFLANAGIQVRLDFPENIPTIPVDAETRHQLALCVREALNNIVRHA